MLQYLKLLVISLVSSFFICLPVSSSGIYAYLSNVLLLSSDSSAISFYYGLIIISFSLVSLFLLRRLIFKGVKVLRSKDAGHEKKSYSTMFLGMLISAVCSLIILIPYSKGKTLSSLFDSFLSSKDMLVAAVSAVLCGIISLVAVWYNHKQVKPVRRSASIADIIKLSLYSAVSSVFPGFSRFFVVSDSLIISGVYDSNVVRDSLMYITPAYLVIGVIKLVSGIKAGVSLIRL